MKQPISQTPQSQQASKIPDEWEKIELGRKIILEYGKGLTEKSRKEGEYKVYGSNGVIGLHNDFLIEGPGIVIGRKGSIGEVVWSENNFWPIDTTYFVKLTNDLVDLRFLYYKLISLKLQKMNSATGTPGLNREVVYAKETYFPKLKEEQTAIAKILSTTDEALEALERERLATERLRRGFMVKLLENQKWKVVKLGEIVEFVKGKKPEKMINEQLEGYLPYLSTDYLRDNEETKYVSTSENIFLVKDGEIVLLWDGSNAGEFFEGKEGILSTTMVKFNLKTDIHQKYLLYLLKSKQNYLQGQTNGTGIPHVDRKVLMDLDITLPPLEEQKRIAEVLSIIDKKLELQKARKEKIERVKKGLMDELLTGKKRVNVEKVLEEEK